MASLSQGLGNTGADGYDLVILTVGSPSRGAAPASRRLLPRCVRRSRPCCQHASRRSHAAGVALVDAGHHHAPRASPRSAPGRRCPLATADALPLDRLLAAVRTLAPLIQAYAEEAEQQRRLPPPVVTALADAGLFRLYTPTPLAGGRWSPSPSIAWWKCWPASTRRRRGVSGLPAGTPCMWGDASRMKAR